MALVVKNPSTSAGDIRDTGLIPGLGRSLGGRAWQHIPLFLPGESRGQRSLASDSLEGLKESETEVTSHIRIFNIRSAL